MKTFIHTIIIAAAALLAACTQAETDTTEATLQEAEMAIAQGDMTAATNVARRLSGDKNLSGLSARQLGRLSLIYMQLADSSDQADNVAAAADCYRRAFTQNADSAKAFYAGVEPEHTARAAMLSSITHSLDSPADSTLIVAEEPDSI